MRIDWLTLGLQLINFAILVWLLQRFLYRPVLRVIEMRRAAVEAAYTEARRIEKAAKDELASLDRQHAAIDAERAASIQAAAALADKQASARRAQAERDAEALLTEARKTVASERERALEETQSAAFALSEELTCRVMGELPESLRSACWLERIARYLDELPRAARAELAGELAGGAPLRVVTATALPPAETVSWRDLLRDKLGPSIALEWTVDPELIAGAELKFPHATLSFSLRSVLAGLRKDVQAHAHAG